MGFVDIHSHFLPGLDDGPETIEASFDMLRKAYQEGFMTIIATPHCSKGFRTYTKDDVTNLCDILNTYAQQNIDSEFKVLPGQEIYYNESALDLIRNEKVVTLGGSEFVLLEFSPDITFSHMLRAIREVSMTKHSIVLAHIERYPCLYDFNNLQQLRQMGIYIQMNYSSFGDGFLSKHTRFCRKCLRNGLIDFLATDMHDDNVRGPNTKKAIQWMHKHLDSEYVRRITETNALNIIFKE